MECTLITVGNSVAQISLDQISMAQRGENGTPILHQSFNRRGGGEKRCNFSIVDCPDYAKAVGGYGSGGEMPKAKHGWLAAVLQDVQRPCMFHQCVFKCHDPPNTAKYLNLCPFLNPSCVCCYSKWHLYLYHNLPNLYSIQGHIT